MAAYKNSLAKHLSKEANDIKKGIKNKKEPLPVATFLQCNEFAILI